MESIIEKYLSKSLREAADKIDRGECIMTNSQASNYIDLVAKEPMSKESACEFLNVSRSKFDGYVRENKIPRGKKERGFKELIWYKSDLIKFIASEKETNLTT